MAFLMNVVTIWFYVLSLYFTFLFQTSSVAQWTMAPIPTLMIVIHTSYVPMDIPSPFNALRGWCLSLKGKDVTTITTIHAGTNHQRQMVGHF